MNILVIFAPENVCGKKFSSHSAVTLLGSFNQGEKCSGKRSLFANEKWTGNGIVSNCIKNQKMKKIGIIALFLAALSLSSCISTSGTSGGNSGVTTAGTAAGVACGQVLSGMYTQYKSTGKVDLTNSTTLINVVQLGTYSTTLIANKNSSAYKQAFATGLITGSVGLITTNNSMATVNSLITLSGLSNINSATPLTSPTATTVATGLTTLLSSLKK